MKYIDRLALDETTTLGQTRTVREIIEGQGRITNEDARTAMVGDIRFEVEKEEDETEFAFGLRIAGLASELAAYMVHIEPGEEKVSR